MHVRLHEYSIRTIVHACIVPAVYLSAPIPALCMVRMYVHMYACTGMCTCVYVRMHVRVTCVSLRVLYTCVVCMCVVRVYILGVFACTTCQ